MFINYLLQSSVSQHLTLLATFSGIGYSASQGRPNFCVRASSYCYVTRSSQRHSVFRSLRYRFPHLWRNWTLL